MCLTKSLATSENHHAADSLTNHNPTCQAGTATRARRCKLAAQECSDLYTTENIARCKNKKSSYYLTRLPLRLASRAGICTGQTRRSRRRRQCRGRGKWRRRAKESSQRRRQTGGFRSSPSGRHSSRWSRQRLADRWHCSEAETGVEAQAARERVRTGEEREWEGCRG